MKVKKRRGRNQGQEKKMEELRREEEEAEKDEEIAYLGMVLQIILYHVFYRFRHVGKISGHKQ